MPSDHTPYALIITRRRATEVLLSTRPSPRSLPRLDIVSGGRFAEQLAVGIMENYHLETYCLWMKISAASRVTPSVDRYAVMETLGRNQELPAAMVWVPLAKAASEAILAPSDQAAIRNWLEDLDRYDATPEMGPFARPAWIEELFCWAKDQIEPLSLTGRFRQLNASPTFSLVRIETTGQAIWFKATGEPNMHELGISVALHRLFPGYVPAVVGVHPIWNGWLSEETPSRTLGELADVGAWTAAAKALAELQIASVAKTNILIQSGCKDLSLRQLVEQIDTFLTHMSALMTMQTKQPPPILTDSEISLLGDRLRTAFFELHQYGLPNTLGHLDVNPRNILVSPARCCFLDWAEGCVTHPLFTFEYFLEHWRRSLSPPEAATRKLVAAYQEPWQSFFSLETLGKAMAVSPLLAVFAYAVASKKCFSLETPRNPTLAGYFRGLTRRAHREAERMAARSDRWLA
jgi:hypothetical protein